MSHQDFLLTFLDLLFLLLVYSLQRMSDVFLHWLHLLPLAIRGTLWPVHFLDIFGIVVYSIMLSLSVYLFLFNQLLLLLLVFDKLFIESRLVVVNVFIGGVKVLQVSLLPQFFLLLSQHIFIFSRVLGDVIFGNWFELLLQFFEFIKTLLFNFFYLLFLIFLRQLNV